MEYFDQAFSWDTSVMPVVIEAFGRFGRHDAFLVARNIAKLAQTPETIDRTINELQLITDKSQAHRSVEHDLGELLCNADPALVLRHEAKILDVLAFDDELRQQFARLVAIHSWDNEACWRELEAICEAGQDKEYAHEAGCDDALQIARSLARRGERHAGRMMALLVTTRGFIRNFPPKEVWLAARCCAKGGRNQNPNEATLAAPVTAVTWPPRDRSRDTVPISPRGCDLFIERRGTNLSRTTTVFN